MTVYGLPSRSCGTSDWNDGEDISPSSHLVQLHKLPCSDLPQPSVEAPRCSAPLCCGSSQTGWISTSCVTIHHRASPEIVVSCDHRKSQPNSSWNYLAAHDFFWSLPFSISINACIRMQPPLQINPRENHPANCNHLSWAWLWKQSPALWSIQFGQDALRKGGIWWDGLLKNVVSKRFIDLCPLSISISDNSTL